MNAQTLINLDDLSKLLIVDYFCSNVRKINANKFVGRYDTSLKEDLKNIMPEFVKSGDINSTISKLDTIVSKHKLLFLFSIPFKRYFYCYSKLYLKFFHQSSPVALEKCIQFSKENHNGVKVIAKRDISAKIVIKNIFGYYKSITPEEEQQLILQNKDFSVINSSITRQQNIFLGSVAFVNHSCDPNIEYINAEKHMVYIRTLKYIRKNEELLVFYGENYFGIDNNECECSTCSMKNRFKSKNICKTLDIIGNEELKLASYSLLDKVVEQVSITVNTSEDLNCSFEDYCLGFSNYVELDKKLNFAYIRLERLNPLIIMQYKMQSIHGSAFCIYCEDFKVQFPRHLRTSHADKDIVHRFLNDCNMDTKLKNSAITFLRNQGYSHYKQLTDIIIPIMSIRKDAVHTVEKVECSNCFSYFSKRTLYSHMKYCQKFTIAKMRNV